MKEIDRILEALKEQDLETKELSKQAHVSKAFLEKARPVLEKYAMAQVIFDTWSMRPGADQHYHLVEDKIESELGEAHPETQESEENIVSQHGPIIIDWDTNESRVINPSLDFLDGIMYVSQQLPVIVPTEFAKGGGMMRQTAIITSERKALMLSPEALMTGIDGIRISTFPDRIENRWSTLGIKAYLRGVSTTPAFLDVFTDIRHELEDKLEFKDPRNYSLIAVWIISTYFLPLFEAFPYIYLIGVKRSGKTKLLKLTATMAFNARPVVSMTSATLFRIAEGNRASILIDEVEGEKLTKDPDFRALLLAGYNKGIRVPRSRKLQSGRWVLDEFTPYSPKMLVNVKGLDDVLEDRAITLIMERGIDKNKINKKVNFNDPVYQPIRDDLYLLCLDRADEVRKQVELVEKVVLNKNTIPIGEITNTTNPTNTTSILYKTLQTLPTLPTPDNISSGIMELISARNEELALPLITVASLCSGTVLNDVIGILADIFTSKKEEDATESADITLLLVLLEIVTEKKFWSIGQIATAMSERENTSWANTRWVGRGIRRLGVSQTKRIVNGRAQVLLDPEAIKKKAQDMGIDISKLHEEEVVAYVPDEETIKKIIRDLCFVSPLGAAHEDVLAKAEERGIPGAEKLMDKMLQAGLIMEPRQGFLRVVGGG